MAPDAQPAPATVAPGALSALLAELVGAPEVPPPEPTPGTVIGRFELVRRLGAGGFGVVWEARDRQLGRKVAFKLIRPGERAELRGESLLREAEAAARLSHDNIVALHDVGKSEYGPYLVLELFRGQTLADRLTAGALPLLEALRIVRDMARGVAHAHAAGVVHRDLKPANVFLCDDGRVKVLDFGLAHAFGRRRQSGGTPAYMAPEQWKDAPEDERTDVFALGVILYQALSGALPFAGEEEAAGSGRAPALEIEAAPELGPLVARMLEKDPLKRPRDAAEVLAALDGVVAALGPASVAAGATASTTAPSVRTRRHPRWRLAGFIAAGLAAGVAIALGVTHLRGRPATVGDRLVVAVADVVNETGEQELDVLSGLLVTSLEQSRMLMVMTQARVLDLAAQAGRIGLKRVDEALGREVGQQNGVTTLLLPVIRRLGSIYTVEMRAVDPVHDQHLFTFTDRSTSKEGLLDLLDRLSEKTRQQLKEDPAELEKSRIQLGTAMTRSLEAYQHYQAGLELRNRDILWAAALVEQEKAVELDPQFAAAHFQLARIRQWYGFGETSPHWEIAYQHMDRMPEKERNLIQLWRVMQPGGHRDPAEGRRLADEILARYPDDKFALHTAATFLARLGRPAEAEAAWRRVLSLDPAYGVALGQIVALLEKRPAEFLVLARRAVAVRRSASTLLHLASALLMTGAEQEAGATALESLRVNDGQSAEGADLACGTLDAVGRVAECLPFLERIAVSGLNDGERGRAQASLAGLLATQGRAREAIAVLRPGCLLGPHEVGHARQDSPEALACLGDFKTAKVALRHILSWYGDMKGAALVDASMQPGERTEEADRVYQGLVAAEQGRFTDAARIWAEHARAVEENPFDAPGWYEVRYLLAEALLGSGRLSEVAEIPAAIPKKMAETWDLALNYPRLALVRARALEGLNRTAEAVKTLDALLEFWKEADQDLPLLVLARIMRLRLVTGHPLAAGDPVAPSPGQLPRASPVQALEVAQADVAASRTAASLTWLAVAQQRAGAREEAARTAREALRLDGGQTPRHALIACELLRQGGDLGACIPVHRAIAERAGTEHARDVARNDLVKLLMVLGRVREGLRVASSGRLLERRAIPAIGRFPYDAPEALVWVRKKNLGKVVLRQNLAWFGDLKGAAAVDATMTAAERSGQPEEAYQALVAAGQGRHDEAIRYYLAVGKDDLKTGRLNYWNHYRLAETLLAAGRAGEAAEVKAPWPTRLEVEDIDLASCYPRLLVIRARANEQLGRKADAVKELEALLAFWKEADADLPLLVEAKAMRARLVGSAK